MRKCCTCEERLRDGECGGSSHGDDAEERERERESDESREVVVNDMVDIVNERWKGERFVTVGS